MPTIVFASPKGGAGKSTSAVILATELARSGANVTIIDCDPNHSVKIWADAGTVPDRIELICDITESSIIGTIKQFDRDGAIVIVDLEGVRSRLTSRAISQADLVITPMGATTLDARIGSVTIELIQEEEEMLDRHIQHAVLFTKTKAVQSRGHRAIRKSLEGQGVDVFQEELLDRVAFAGLFTFGGDLHSMADQGNMIAARTNAAAFARAVLTRLSEEA